MGLMSSVRERFHELHRSGTFVMPNPWDVGSARRLESMGFSALATTSSGHAASLGKQDREVTLDELVHHVGQLCAAVDIPVSVDLEWGFVDDAGELGGVIDALADAGAAGCSLEDYHPRDRSIVSIQCATERVAAGVAAANARGLVLTARAENHIHGHDDLDDTIERLTGFIGAGAHAIFAPGVRDEAGDCPHRVAGRGGQRVGAARVAFRR